MTTLLNVYCLGCKTRHAQVEMNEVIEMQVRGSTRFQGKGICENGKTWCKILKMSEIPEKSLNIPVLIVTPDEGDINSMSVFEKGAAIGQVEEPVIEEPVIEEPVIEEPVIEEPVIEEPVIEEPVIEEPVIEEPVIEEPVIEEPVIEEPVIEEPVIEELVHIPTLPTEVVGEDHSLEESKGGDDEDISGGQEPSKVPIVDSELSERNIVRPSHISRNLSRRKYRPQPDSRRRNISPRQIKRPEEPKVVVPQPSAAAEIDRAKKVGDFMGRSMFNAVGDEYTKYLKANWERTKIHPEHFEYFEAAYLAGGAIQTAEKKAPESQMDAKTIAGIAGVGILAAWFASQLNGSDSP